MIIPSEREEIGDSAAEDSSPPERKHQPEVESNSRLNELLTPVKKNRWTGDPLDHSNVTIMVKTPGGTLRRCGEDAFRCGRSFCFRCGARNAVKA